MDPFVGSGPPGDNLYFTGPPRFIFKVKEVVNPVAQLIFLFCENIILVISNLKLFAI